MAEEYHFNVVDATKAFSTVNKKLKEKILEVLEGEG